MARRHYGRMMPKNYPIRACVTSAAITRYIIILPNGFMLTGQGRINFIFFKFVHKFLLVQLSKCIRGESLREQRFGVCLLNMSGN